MDDGTPFHGSIVRGLDATDPANIKVLGEAKLGGWVQDDRVVGDVLYAVSEDYGWDYGWGYGARRRRRRRGSAAASPAGRGRRASSSRRSASRNGVIQRGRPAQPFPGYSGVFNVTPNSILLAHDAPTTDGAYSSTDADRARCTSTSPIRAARSCSAASLTVDGAGRRAGAPTTAAGTSTSPTARPRTSSAARATTVLRRHHRATSSSTADFSNPDAPALALELAIPSTGLERRPRASTPGRLYLSPDSYYYGTGGTATPFQVYDLTNPTAPALAGHADTSRARVWNILPAPDAAPLRARQRLEQRQTPARRSRCKYLDVTNAGVAAAHRHVDVRPGLGLDAGRRHLQGVHDGRHARAGRAAVHRLGLPRRRRTTTACSSSSSPPTSDHHRRRGAHQGLGRARHLRAEPPGLAQRPGARGRRLHEPAPRRR